MHATYEHTRANIFENVTKTVLSHSFTDNISEALKGPSFVSDWKSLSVDDPTTDIHHNLGAYPLKVDVQILVTKEGVDYIFTGSGAAQRDDDKNFYFGGVIYIYNTEIVRIIVPEASKYAGIAYTGELFFNLENTY